MTRRFGFTVLLAALALATPRASFAAGDIESAKALYASASYEEALSTLDQIGATGDPIQVNEYRALCLLALGRTRDAEAPLQEIVTANPLYKLAPGDVSPRLVDLFKDVRKRTLPAAARQLYAKAKASFDAKNSKEAVEQFETLLAILKDPDVASAATDLGDLKDLADGFHTLAAAQVAAAAKAAPPPPPAAPAAASAAAAAGPRVYSAADGGVKPPIEIDRQMPRWSPASIIEKRLTYRGALRLVIDEQGRVESASLITPVTPSYNADLLRAAKTWVYQPATLQGNPVKYTLTLEVVLLPTGNEEHEG